MRRKRDQARQAVSSYEIGPSAPRASPTQGSRRLAQSLCADTAAIRAHSTCQIRPALHIRNYGSKLRLTFETSLSANPRRGAHRTITSTRRELAGAHGKSASWSVETENQKCTVPFPKPEMP